MGHDATKVVLGAAQSNHKDVSQVNADPAVYIAGLAVRRTSLDVLSVTKADGMWIGISLGKSLSDHKKTAVCRSGLRVPVLLEAAPARQVFTVTSYANLVITSNDTLKIGATTFTFKTSAVGENDVLCAASGSTNTVVGAALAAAINAHSVAGPLFKAVAVNGVVTVTAKNNATVGTTIDAVYTDTHSADIGLTVAADAITFVGGGTTATDFVTIGAKVYFSDTTGKADDPNSAATISDAVYVSGVLSGYDEAGNEVAAALVDMQGGL